jgi:hypothetical protein
MFDIVINETDEVHLIYIGLTWINVHDLRKIHKVMSMKTIKDLLERNSKTNQCQYYNISNTTHTEISAHKKHKLRNRDSQLTTLCVRSFPYKHIKSD